MTNMKFRAWDKEEKKMIYFSMEDIKSNFGFEYGIPDNLKPLYDDDFKSSDFMQFTGLLDKQGVEICDGDILRNPTWIGADTNLLICVFTNSQWALESDDYRVPAYNRSNEFEVIGNIYENPELLES